jgi:hypothetical protein
MTAQRCLFCGGDASEADHLRRCDGRQGAIEAVADAGPILGATIITWPREETRRLGMRYDSNTRARFTEGRDLGLIREVGERACRVTGQTCITWAIVPEKEYAGRADVQRCPTCGQITARIVPRWERAAR